MIPLGKEMVQAAMRELPTPTVVADDPRDNAKLKAVKKLIRQMTQYRVADRKPMSAVLRVIEDIDGGHTSQPFYLFDALLVMYLYNELLFKLTSPA